MYLRTAEILLSYVILFLSIDPEGLGESCHRAFTTSFDFCLLLNSILSKLDGLFLPKEQQSMEKK